MQTGDNKSAVNVLSGTGGRRLQQAVEYVKRQWFPVNPQIAAEIQTKLNEDKYSQDVRAVIADLKQDFALFTYCLKKVKELDRLNDLNPVNSLYKLSFDELKEILSAPMRDISKHEMSSAEKGQALRIKHTVLSCATAELLADSKNISSDTAFACALIKQLGLNLIAWNYPSIYTRAMMLVKSGSASLEEILTESLGFDPAELADQLIFTAHTSPLILKAAGSPRSLTYTQNSLEQHMAELEEEGEISSLVDICEISEAFAQLNDPEHHPNISRNFETILGQIDENLGQNGMSVIMGSVNAKFSTYVSSVPEVFKTDTSLDAALAKVAQDYTNKLFERNIYAQKCPDNIKKQIREVYRHITRGQVSSIGVGYLVNKVIPIAGFGNGCVYLLDGKGVNLVPKLRIGPEPLSRYKTVNCSMVTSDVSLLVEALYCTMPIKQQGVFLHGEVVSPILGPIGSREPVGVLYIEMGEGLTLKDGHEPITLFKAIRDCLNDCLNL